MVYTEVKERNRKKYYYRVLSIRKGKMVSKLRKYLGVNLLKPELSLKEEMADKELSLVYKDRKKELSENIKKKIIGILIRNNVKRAGIFGSYARGEGKKGSDLDILIEPPKGIGFGFVKIQSELQNKLKRKVDLLSYNAINPLLKEKILKEEIRII